MSSAILYLAIIAIWACVLVPRWLRRDGAHGAVNTDTNADPDADARAHTAAPASDEPTAPAEVFADASTADTASPGAQESRRRMLTARRRLLSALAALEVAAITLTVIGMTPLWVVIPPTIMLGGYLLLLREAARADAESAQREAEAAAARTARAARAEALARSSLDSRAQAGQYAPLTATAAATAATAAATAASTAAELAARFAAAPVPADYEEPGRDFAPGLAGKYTASNADFELTEAEYRGYEVPRLRAVGD